MERRKFRIGELAEKLKVKRFVIRFWEKEFALSSDRSGGGQRCYTESDLQKFALIKELLYEKRMTIEGAKKIIQEQLDKELVIQASSITSIQDFENSKVEEETSCSNELLEQLVDLREKLIKLSDLL
ncbi:MerR family transcriptional regulator [Candidatus Dependentiae bacterium]|nr:MerR family transcriptional regulator [Candidatus Dependentiae bacterium]